MSKDDPTTEQLMEAATQTVEQMSPKEKAELCLLLEADLQKMKAALKDVPQLAPEETAKLRQDLRLEVPATGTLQEFVEGLELSYRRLAPAEKKQWMDDVRKACARFNSLQKTKWVQ